MENLKSKLGQEPAFPCEHFPQDSTIEGISKRFYAACAIAQGLCGNSNYGVNTNRASEFAKTCYKLADELLKQEND